MGRLIDVDELISVLGRDKNVGEIITLEDIDSIPTAYDPDKVMEELGNVAYERYGNDGMGGERVVNLDDVIDIVKGGGVDG